MNYYSHHIGDYLLDTAHLSFIEDAAYRRLIDRYYTQEAPLVDDLVSLCRIVRASTTEEKDAVANVLNEFFTRTEDGWSHKRCNAEIIAYQAKAKANRENGVKGGRPKKNPQITQSVSDQNPQETLTSNQEPRTSKPLTTTDVVVVASDAANEPIAKKKIDCPHQDIIAIYHEVLPMCQRIRDWTPARAVQLRARWNEDERRQNLTYWREFFAYVASCDFLVGRGSKPFFVDLEWITKANNFAKIREGKYENRETA